MIVIIYLACAPNQQHWFSMWCADIKYKTSNETQAKKAREP